MAEPVYKLSSILSGHKADVRAVAAFADGTIVSTSRDKTAFVWKPTGNGRDYVHNATLKGHSNFVSSVCVINPTERYPTGFIVTGSNDKTICVYIPDQVEPAHVIQAHEDTVCKLRTGKREGTFLSSSWDLCAKLWDVGDLSKPKLTLSGHTAAVWCVGDAWNGCIITGSADKFVIVWNPNGSIQHKLSGHTDCVRDVAVLKNNEFLTCANDATVRHWSISLGTCLRTYDVHVNYIYSILCMDNDTRIVTCSEDGTIKISSNDKINQTIALPVQSIWCIDSFANGDIVSGSSDGVVRIFSCNPDKYADAEILQFFDAEVSNTKSHAAQELGGIKIQDLPDPKALLQPGQKDGETKMINEGGNVTAYSWSQSEQKWILIGDVMGASGGTAATSGKQLYNGVEYDYVFSVDIQDGVPPLKLPYNNGQDPWHIAQKFLHDNGLSQLFLDQVANFIIKNAGPSPVLSGGAQYADPFTGGSRYIPESTVPNSSTQREFGKPTSLSSSNVSPSSSYIPHTKYLKIEQANLPVILDKLRELNSKQKDTYKLPEETLESVVKLTADKVPEQLKSVAISALKILLDWPDETVFPALDIARLAVLCKEAHDALCTDDLLQNVKKHIKSDASPSNQMLTFRLLANMFTHEKGEKLCLNFRDEISKALLELNSLGSKNNQVAISTYMLNLIVALNKYNDTSGRTRTLDVLFSMLPRLNEPEAVFRTLVGLGTLLSATSDPKDRNELIEAVRQSEVALNVLRTISETTVSTNTSNKLVNCSKQIIDIII